MEQDQQEHSLSNQGPSDTGEELVMPELYPPKPHRENKQVNVWVRSISSLALYLLIGYFFFSANWILLIILTAIVIFHELGHFFAMKIFRYEELGIFFIPLLGAYASGTKREVSQKQSAIILLAGPIPGIVAGVILFLLTNNYQVTSMSYQNFSLLRNTATLLIFLNILNLLPIYPLDGGQLLNRLFLDDSKLIGTIFVVLSALALGYFAVSIKFYPLLVFPAMMLFRLRTDTKSETLTRKVEEQGINLEKTYEEITDEEYWKIRNILIEHSSSLKNIPVAPPYEYSASEEKVVSAIENILQRTVTQDLSWVGKLLILVIWVGSFAAPFLLEMDLPFLHYQTR